MVSINDWTGFSQSEEVQKKALLCNTLASLRLNGWWNSLSRCLVVGSMGPRSLSAARRVFSIGRLVNAASACSDRGAAWRRRISRLKKHCFSTIIILFLTIIIITLLYDMYQHWESQKRSWLPFSGWLRSPPGAGLKFDPDGKLSASLGWRQCTSPNSAGPEKKYVCVWGGSETTNETVII